MHKKLTDAEKAKALYRRAMAQVVLKEENEAIADLELAAKLQPEDGGIKAQCVRWSTSLISWATVLTLETADWQRRSSVSRIARRRRARLTPRFSTKRRAGLSSGHLFAHSIRVVSRNGIAPYTQHHGLVGEADPSPPSTLSLVSGCFDSLSVALYWALE